MPDRLAGKSAIVTGAGSRAEGIGNGRATAILFAREGADLLLVDRDEAAVQATLDMIRAEGNDAAIAVADVTSTEDCARIVADAVSRYGKLDVLHNNVGIGGRGTVEDVSEVEWEHVQRVNVTSMMLTCKHAVPALRENGGGAITNVSSIAALRPRGLTAYSVSKAAVATLTQALAVDHGRDRIRANCIMPGPVYTPMVLLGGNVGRTARAAQERQPAQARGRALGHRLGCGLPGQRRGQVRDRRDPPGGRRGHGPWS